MPNLSKTSMTATRLFRYALAILLALAVSDVITLAQRGGRGGGSRGGGGARSASRSSVSRNTGANRSANVNRNTNVNRNADVNRNVNRDIDRDIDVDRDFDFDRDIDVDIDGGWGCCYHGGGWGAAAAVATTAAVTAAVVGTRVYTLPSSCTVVVVNGFSYQQCGNVWYQPQISGSSTTYVVVDDPH